jgi:hypothetical protein
MYMNAHITLGLRPCNIPIAYSLTPFVPHCIFLEEYFFNAGR